MFRTINQVSPRVVAILFVCVFFYSPAANSQVTIHVPADQPSIQAAINNASNGDTVLVSPGTYTENIIFSGKAITVVSSGGPEVTIIDGGAVSSVVQFKNSETNASVLQGFTIQNGASNFNTGYAGGGILVSNASPKIIGNVVKGNQSCNSAAITVNFGSAIIQDNIIKDNTLCGTGGIYVGGVAATQVIHNTISNNYYGITLWSSGAAIIRGNTIVGNHGTGQGGGMYIVNSSPAFISGNLIANNTASQGGGVYWTSPPAQFINNTVANNDATQGSVINAYSFANTLIQNNLLIAKLGQSAIRCETSSDIVPANFKQNNVYSSGAPAYINCTNQTATNQNTSADPLFMDAATGNYRLQKDSPAVDSGSNAVVPVELVKDLDGNTRIVDGNGDNTATVDLGAYEFQGLTTLTTSVPSLNFANQKIGTQSAPQQVTITNTGAKPLQLGLSTSPEFLQTNTCSAPQGVAPGNSCDVSVVFAPTAPGAHNSQVLTIVANTANSPITVNLSGIATAPVVQLQPGSLTFSSRDLFTTSAAQNITLTNTGDADLVVGSVAATGDFARTTDCATVVPSASCTISVTFTPVARGVRAGAISVVDDALGSPHIAPLSGTGTGAAAVFTPNPLLFPNQRTGTLSLSKQMVLSNPGESALNISNISITGDFTGTNDCPASLAPTEQCTFSLAFAPTLTGLRNGAVIVTDNAAGSPQSLPLSGLATSPVAVVLTSVPQFGSFVVGTSSAPRSMLIKNSGTDLLTISSVSISGDYSQTNSCNIPLPPNFVCSIIITFSPTGAGQRAGALTIVHDAPGSPYQLSITGTGLATYPVPTLDSASPGGFKAGLNGATVTVSGSGFYPASVVRWNDSPRVTQYVSATSVSATLTTDDLASIGEGRITVFNPSPGGGVSNSIIAPIYATVTVSARDMVYDRFRKLFWVTVAGGSPTNANSVVSINPQTGALGQSIALGGEGHKLAMSDDGQFLYVGLDGSFSVRRVNLNTNTADLLFSLGADSFFGGYAAEDMQVIPGNPHALVVSRANWGVSAHSDSVVIYDDGVIRPQRTFRNQGIYANYLRFGSDPTILYGSDAEISDFSFYRFNIGASGITLKDATWSLGGTQIETDGSLVYKPGGQAINPTTLAAAGHFTFPSNYYYNTSVWPDASTGRVFFLGGTYSQGSIIFAGNPSDFTLAGSLQLPEGSGATSLSRWGTDGLAFRLYSGSSNLGGYSSSDKIVILRSGGLTNPSTGNNPVPAISTLSPAVKTVGDGNFILTVSGSNFVPGARVQWNGADRETSFQNSSTLTAAIPASDIIRGPVNVTVVNPTPAGGVSAPKSMAVNGSSLSFSPASVDVPATSYRRSSTPIPVIVHNNTAAPVSISSIAITGDFSQTNNCGVSLAANGNCTINVSFSAMSVGSQTGTVTVSTNTDDSPSTIPLTASGTDFTIALARPARANRTATNAVVAGQSAHYELVVSGTTAAQEPVVFECSGAPVGTTCSVEPGSTVLTGREVAVKVILNAASVSVRKQKPAVAPGPFTLQVTGRSGGVSHTATIQGALVLRSMRLR